MDAIKSADHPLPGLVMSFDPVVGGDAIRECANRIAKGVTICGNQYAPSWPLTGHTTRRSRKAYIDAGGAAHERKYIAELATVEEREARDVADAAYRYSDRQAKAFGGGVRAMQSVGASIRSMYGVAGRGSRESPEDGPEGGCGGSGFGPL
ncbi:hypothetical protein GS884_09100 [Rhodococcus hoagii]|nr:hypothetical protein [Prescottella equi]